VSTDPAETQEESTAPPASAPGEPSEAELRAAYEAELARITPAEVMLQAAVSLLNIGARRLGLTGGADPSEAAGAAGAGPRPERDLDGVRDAIDGKNSIEMIDLMLQQFREISFFIGANFVPPAFQILVAHGNAAVPGHLHENRQKAQASVPDNNFISAALNNLGIHERPWLGPRQLQKYEAQVHTDLRSGNGPAIARGFSPIRERVSEIRDDRPSLGRGRILDTPRDFPKSRIAELQNRLNRHAAHSLRRKLILNLFGQDCSVSYKFA